MSGFVVFSVSDLKDKSYRNKQLIARPVLSRPCDEPPPLPPND